jgi:hypothetical protein
MANNVNQKSNSCYIFLVEFLIEMNDIITFIVMPQSFANRLYIRQYQHIYALIIERRFSIDQVQILRRENDIIRC